MVDNKDLVNKAVALAYDLEVDNAPKVVASGRGELADNIIGIAEQFGITVYKNRDLVDQLLKLQLGQEIPAEFYGVVAEVFSFLLKVENGIEKQGKIII